MVFGSVSTPDKPHATNMGTHPRTKFERGTSRQTIRKPFQEHIPRFGKMNVDQNDPEIEKDGQTLVDEIEVNATSKNSRRSDESRSE